MSVELLRSELTARGCDDLVPHVDRLAAALDQAEYDAEQLSQHRENQAERIKELRAALLQCERDALAETEKLAERCAILEHALRLAMKELGSQAMDRIMQEATLSVSSPTCHLT